MPFLRKLCSRLCCLKCSSNALKIEDSTTSRPATNLISADKSPSFVSNAETEKMTEIIDDNLEDEHNSSSIYELPERTRHQNVNLHVMDQFTGRPASGVRRSHGLLTPHPSTGNAYAEDHHTVHFATPQTERNIEYVSVQAQEQETMIGSVDDTTARIINAINPLLSEGESSISYASVGIQTSRSYISSRTSGSDITGPTRSHCSGSLHGTPPRFAEVKIHRSPIVQSRSRSGSPKPARSRTTPPPESPRAPKKKPSFILQGEREGQAVLDDLKHLKSERRRLVAELRRIINLERDYTSLFCCPIIPANPDGENNHGCGTVRKPETSGEAANDVQVTVNNVGNESLEYVSLTSEEERRVRFEAERQSAALAQDYHRLTQSNPSENILVPAIQSDRAASPSAFTHDYQTPRIFADASTSPIIFPNTINSANRGSNASALRQEPPQHPYHFAVLPPSCGPFNHPAHVPSTPNRSLGRNSVQQSMSTPTSNGLGPAFTFGEGTSISGTTIDRASLSRGMTSLVSFEEELGPPPIRDPDSYYIWFDLETNDAARPASNIRILEVAISITDKNFVRLDNGVSYLVHWPFDAVYIASEMPEKVRTMHEKSGLLEAYANTPQERRLTLAQVEQYVCRYLKRHDVLPIGRGIMAGAGIAFDRGMVRQHMKTLDKYFGHQIFDTSSVWQLVKRKYSRGQRFQERCAHRALEDIYGSMREAKMFSETVLKAPRDVSWPSTRGH